MSAATDRAANVASRPSCRDDLHRAADTHFLPNHFIEQYFAGRKVVNQLKLEFGRDIVVTVLLKNLDGSDKVYRASVDNIDNHIPEKYSESDLLN